MHTGVIVRAHATAAPWPERSDAPRAPSEATGASGPLCSLPAVAGTARRPWHGAGRCWAWSEWRSWQRQGEEKLGASHPASRVDVRRAGAWPQCPGGRESGLGAVPLGIRGFTGADHRVWTPRMRAGQRLGCVDHDPAGPPAPREFAHGCSLASGAEPGTLQAPARPRCKGRIGQGPGLGTHGPPELRTLRGRTPACASLGVMPRHPSPAPAWVTVAALPSLPCRGSSRDKTVLGTVSRALVGEKKEGACSPPHARHP